jgi:cell division initiation protein
MLTASEIQNVKFTKTMGGYKTYEVEEFLERCAETVGALTTSKIELEKKLEILADKLVEYRNDEDNIRTALLSAQKLGDTVVREAKHKAERILEDAKNKAEKIHENARKSIREEELELERIKREVTNFKSRMLSIYREHLSLIDILPEINDQETESKEEVDTTQDLKQADEKKEEKANAQPVPKPVEQPDEGKHLTPVPEVVIDIPQINDNDDDGSSSKEFDNTVEIKPVSKFGDLKFGDDYDISKDVSSENIGFFRRRK